MSSGTKRIQIHEWNLYGKSFLNRLVPINAWCQKVELLTYIHGCFQTENPFRYANRAGP